MCNDEFSLGDRLQFILAKLVQATSHSNSCLTVIAKSWKDNAREASVDLSYQGFGTPFTGTLRIAKKDAWQSERIDVLGFRQLKPNVAQKCFEIRAMSNSHEGFHITRLPLDNHDLQKGYKYCAEIFLHSYLPDDSPYVAKFVIPLHGYMMHYDYNILRATKVEKRLLQLLNKLVGTTVVVEGLRTFIYACMTGDVEVGHAPFMLTADISLNVYEHNRLGDIYFWVKQGDTYLMHWNPLLEKEALMTF